jgi:hypothetical protein
MSPSFGNKDSASQITPTTANGDGCSQEAQTQQHQQQQQQQQQQLQQQKQQQQLLQQRRLSLNNSSSVHSLLNLHPEPRDGHEQALYGASSNDDCVREFVRQRDGTSLPPMRVQSTADTEHPTLTTPASINDTRSYFWMQHVKVSALDDYYRLNDMVHGRTYNMVVAKPYARS